MGIRDIGGATLRGVFYEVRPEGFDALRMQMPEQQVSKLKTPPIKRK
jgi:hypothetical protein